MTHESLAVATYHLLSEALTKVAKYARATSAAVTVPTEHDRVIVEIVDDGIGGPDPTRGSGVRGLSDRLQALGGHLSVASAPASGTCPRGIIPSG